MMGCNGGLLTRTAGMLRPRQERWPSFDATTTRSSPLFRSRHRVHARFVDLFHRPYAPRRPPHASESIFVDSLSEDRERPEVVSSSTSPRAFSSEWFVRQDADVNRADERSRPWFRKLWSPNELLEHGSQRLAFPGVEKRPGLAIEGRGNPFCRCTSPTWFAWIASLNPISCPRREITSGRGGESLSGRSTRARLDDIWGR